MSYGDFYKNLNEESQPDESEKVAQWWDEITSGTKPEEIEQTKRKVQAEIKQRIINLEGHNGSIQALCASTDKEEIFSGSFDNNIMVWDIKTRNIKTTLSGHVGGITALAYSSKYNYLASGSSDGGVVIWDLSDYTKCSGFSIEYGAVSGLRFSTSQTYLWASGEECIVKFNMASKFVERIIKCEKQLMVSALCVSSDELTLFTAHENQIIRAWNLQVPGQEAIIEQFSAHDQYITCLEIEFFSVWLFSGSKDGSVRIWDVRDVRVPSATGAPKKPREFFRVLKESEAVIHSIALSFQTFQVDPNEPAKFISIPQFLYTASGDHKVRKYELKFEMNETYMINDTPTVVLTMEGHTNEIMSLCLGKDKLLYTGSLDMSIRSWECETGKLVHNFEGHAEGISVVRVTNSEDMLISGSFDNSIKIWNLEAKRCERILQGHSQKINDILIYEEFLQKNSTTENGISGRKRDKNKDPNKDFIRLRTLYTASEDHTIKVWNVEKGEIKTTYPAKAGHSGHNDAVTALAYSSKKKLLCSASRDRTIKFWDVTKEELVTTLPDHEKAVLTLVLSFNEAYLYSGGEDCSIKVWSMNTRTCTDTLYGHQNNINKIIPSGGALNLYSCSKDKTIKGWSVEERTCKITLVGHKDEIFDISLSVDNSILFSASLDKTIKVWDLKVGECINTLFGHTESVTCLLTLKKQYAILSGSMDRSIRMWKLDIPLSKNSIIETPDYTKPSINLHMVDNYQYLYQQGPNLPLHTMIISLLISVHEDDTIFFWDAIKREIVDTLKTTSVVVASSLDREKKYMYTGHMDCKIRMCNLKTRTYDPVEIDCGMEPVSWIVVSKTSDFLYTGGKKASCAVRVTHIPSKDFIRELIDHKQAIHCTVIHPDDTFLFTGGLDKDIKVWDLFQLTTVATLKGHGEPISALQLDPRGFYLYSGSHDRSVKVWSLVDYKLVITLFGHQGTIHAIGTSSNGNFIFTGSSDETIGIWSTINFCKINSFTFTGIEIRSLCCANDSTFMYSGGNNGKIRAWNFSTMTTWKGLDLFTLESMMGYLISETYQEKETNLKNLISCLKHSDNNYYIHRVNPTMFLANLQFNRVLEIALRTFGYPTLTFSKYQALLYRVLKDNDKRQYHLDTLCDFLYENSDQIILYDNIIDRLIQSTNVKLQKLLMILFEKNIEPQQGSYLQKKGKLRDHNHSCITISNTKVVCEYEQNILLEKEAKDIKNIEYLITKFPIDLRNGCTCSRNFFRGLDDCMNDVLLSDYQHIINYKWKMLKPFIFIHAMGFWLLILLMSIHLVFAQRSVALLVLCAVLNVIYICYEIICAWGEFMTHLLRDMNWLDLLCLGVKLAGLALPRSQHDRPGSAVARWQPYSAVLHDSVRYFVLLLQRDYVLENI